MNILLLSDLHLEYAPYVPVAEGFDVAVLAGDIHTKGRGVAWAQQHFTVPVIYVPGNHEGYGQHWQKTLEKMRAAAQGSNVHVLDCQALVIDGVRFLGATAWTDFSLAQDPRVAMAAAGAGRDPYSSGMRDYRYIRTAGYRRLRPSDTLGFAQAARNFLVDAFAQPHAGPTVVATHHAPSARSLEGRGIPDILDAADASAWDDLVASSGAALWCHGHTHHRADYRLGGTRVVANARGYPGQDIGHRPDFIIPVA